jgi:hypothetical protein
MVSFATHCDAPLTLLAVEPEDGAAAYADESDSDEEDEQDEEEDTGGGEGESHGSRKTAATEGRRSGRTMRMRRRKRCAADDMAVVVLGPSRTKPRLSKSAT